MEEEDPECTLFQKNVNK